MSTPRIRQERFAAIITFVGLVAAWVLGGMRQEASLTDKLGLVSTHAVQFEAAGENAWQGKAGDGTESGWFSIATAVGYGGPIEIVGALDNKGAISGLAITESAETASYLARVIESGLIDKFVGKPAAKIEVADGISGATLTSQAVQHAVVLAAHKAGHAGFDMPLPAQKTEFHYPTISDGLVLLLFLAAVAVNRPGFKHKIVCRRIVMGCSLAFLGFYAAAPFGSGTIGYLLSGFWLDGIASYTSLLLLLVTVIHLLASNKNVYCTSVCPFGVAQECIGKLNKAKACKPKHSVFQWLPRVLFTVVLMLGVYFRSPTSLSYEPFGMAFNMIGSHFLFALTVLIVLASLFIHRPWCQTLCPVTHTVAYLRLMKQWGKSLRKPRRGRIAARPQSRQPAKGKRDANAAPGKQIPVRQIDQ